MTLRESLKWLVPYEQGAWGLMLVPFFIGALIGQGNPIGLFSLLASALGVFLLRQPVIRWCRSFHRDPIDTLGTPWPTQATLFCIALFLAGAILLLIQGLWWLVPIFALAAGIIFSRVFLSAFHQQFKLISKIVETLVLSLLAPSAYYVATGRWDTTAFQLWLICSIYFSVVMADLRLRIARYRFTKELLGEEEVHKRRHDVYLTILFAGLLYLGAWAFRLVPLQSIVCLVPLPLRYWRDPIPNPSDPLAIRRIGWQEITFAALFAVIVVLVFRGGMK